MYYFQSKNHVKTRLITNVSLKTFYSRLGFTVIKYFVTSTTFEAARRKFHYETVKSKADQKKTIGLQCLHTIPRRVTFLDEDRMNLNIQKNVFRDLDGISTSETWFLKKYIEDDIKKKVDKTRDNLTSDEMEYDIRHYIHCLKHNNYWVGGIKNDINKLLVNREYIDFFIQIYEQWSSDNSIKGLPNC